MHITEDHISTPRRTRREHPPEFKARLVEASLKPGASVSALALEHSLNANLLFAWRRAHLRAQARSSELHAVPAMLPVAIVAGGGTDVNSGGESIASRTSQAAACRALSAPPLTPGHIELRFCGVDLRVYGSVDESSLRMVLGILRDQAR